MGCVSSKKAKVEVRPVPHLRVDLSSSRSDHPKAPPQVLQAPDDTAAASPPSTYTKSRDGAPGPEPLSVVRLFVSSTFVDFRSEREALAKAVLGELREWAATRGVAVVEVDLRWGVPKEATGRETLETCLGELERCGEGLGGASAAFFLGLLGGRYGWVPPKEDFGSFAERLAPLEGASLTEMEMSLAALASAAANPNAVFALRSPGLRAQLPEEHTARWFDDDQSRVQKLRREVEAKYAGQCFEYSPSVKAGTEVELVGLEEFQAQVLRRLKAAVETELRRRPSQDAHQRDPALLGQHFFRRQQAERFVGRSEELKQLEKFASKGASTTLGRLGEKPAEGGGEAAEPGGVLAVVGPRGTGKSALLAELSTRLGSTALYHSASGSSADATDAHAFLRRLRRFLVGDGGGVGAGDETGATLYARVKEALEASSSEGLVVVVDGVDQMSDETSSLQHLSWLPSRSAARIVVSATDSSLPSMSRLDDRRPWTLQLGPLSLEEQGQLVERYFGEFGKRVDTETRAALLGTGELGRGGEWLGLALAELRLHANFRDLSERARAFPATLPDLAAQVCDRMLGDAAAEDRGRAVKRTLSLLQLAPEGLAEWAMAGLVGTDGLHWARTRRSLQPFLRSHPDGRLALTSPAVRQMVAAKLLPSEALRRELHGDLAAFYDAQHGLFDVRVFGRLLAQHLLLAGKRKELGAFVFRDRRAMVCRRELARAYVAELWCGRMVGGAPGAGEAKLCLRCGPTPTNCAFCADAGATETLSLCREHSAGRGPERCLLCEALVAPPTPSQPAKACRFCRGLGPAKCPALPK